MKTHKKILVTGASGFIGSHLVERLVREDYDVKVLVRKREQENFLCSKKFSGQCIRKNSKPYTLFENPSYDRGGAIELLKGLDVEIVFGDLLDKDSLENAVGGVDFIFHLAAIARPMAIPNELYFRVNERGTKNLFEVAKDKKIKKIIMMSSVSAVGPSRDGFAVNESNECKPVDVYGWSKLAQERVAEKYFKEFGMPIVILRPPMVFGPRDFEMLRLFKAVNKRFFPLSSCVKGTEFLYVENLVEACLLALNKGLDGEKYHVTNGEHYSINDIVKAIENGLRKQVVGVKFPKFVFVAGGYFVEGVFWLLGKHPPFKHDTVKWMSEKFWYSSDEKLRKLGYVADVSLDEGVKKTCDYYIEGGYLQRTA